VGVANFFLGQSLGIDKTKHFVSSMKTVGDTVLGGLWHPAETTCVAQKAHKTTCQILNF